MPINKNGIAYHRASEVSGSIDCRLYGFYVKTQPVGPRMRSFLGVRGTAIHDHIAGRKEFRKYYMPPVETLDDKKIQKSMITKEQIVKKELETQLTIDKMLAEDNYEDFMDEYQVAPVAVELRLFTDKPFPISGRMDLIANVNVLDKPVIIDWKYSSRKLKSHKRQLLLYHWLCTQNDIEITDEMWVVLLKRKDKALVCRYDYDEKELMELCDYFAGINEPITPDNIKIRCLFCTFLPQCPLYQIY